MSMLRKRRNSMKSKLKRCPWCNSHDLKVECNTAVCWIKCECDACGPSALTIEDAVDYWNNGVNVDCLIYKRSSNQHEMKEVDL